MPSLLPAQSSADSNRHLADALPLQRDAGPAWQPGGAGLASAMAMVALLAALALWAVRRRSRQSTFQPGMKATAGSGGLWRQIVSGRPAGGTSLIQSMRLSAHASVHVVRWDGREWLLGCADGSVTVIGQRQEAAEEDDAGAAGRGPAG